MWPTMAVAAADGHPDMPPPAPDPQEPVGTHLILDCGDLRGEQALPAREHPPSDWRSGSGTLNALKRTPWRSMLGGTHDPEPVDRMKEDDHPEPPHR